MAEFKDFIFLCSHFSLTTADRVASVQLINKEVEALHKRVFLAGDLNATPESEAIESLSEHWTNLTGKQSTCPSSGPKECIDFIWGINLSDFTYSIIKLDVVPEKITSDLCPVFVDVKFN